MRSYAAIQGFGMRLADLFAVVAGCIAHTNLGVDHTAKAWHLRCTDFSHFRAGIQTVGIVLIAHHCCRTMSCPARLPGPALFGESRTAVMASSLHGDLLYRRWLRRSWIQRLDSQT